MLDSTPPRRWAAEAVISHLKTSAGWLIAGSAITLFAVVLVQGGLGSATRDAADTSKFEEACTWQNARSARSPKKRRASRKIMLTPGEGSAQRVINVDHDRDVEYVRGIRLEASQPLPRWLKPEYLEIYADPLVRTGDEALETVSFPQPKFIKPRILSGGRRIDFGVCLDPADLPAGRYTGLISIGGPPSMGGTTVAITANTKDSRWFVRGLLIALLASLVTLLFRGAAEKRLENRRAPTEQDPNPPWDPWGPSMRAALRDPQFLFTSFAAIATAFGALYTSYANDPAWGATGPSSVFALVVTAFAAVGGQTLLAGLRQGGASAGGR